MKKLTYAIALVVAAIAVAGCKDGEKNNTSAPVAEHRKTDDAKQF
ncbi:hypothetical protein [Pseudomonas arcuscaelestis]|nr:hypothetical protein [Pseudomonas arcuscaelestis]